MTKIQQMAVRVTRAKDTPPPLGGDLFGWIDIVWDAVQRNHDDFGAGDAWDVWPMEIHMNHVIVEDLARGQFFRADIAVNAETEKVSFTNVQRVQHLWEAVDGDAVARGEDVPHPDLQTVLVDPPAADSGQVAEPSQWAGTAVAGR